MITQYDFGPVLTLDILSKVACTSAKTATKILAAGGGMSEDVVKAFALAEDANRSLTEFMSRMASSPDPMPEDGTPFWVAGATQDSEVKLARIGVLPDRTHWGKVLHTVDGNVWLSRDFFCLWWPLSLFPLAADDSDKPAKRKPSK